MNNWKPDICIYHGGCDDGFAAAWAVNYRWPDAVEFVQGVYGNPPPDVKGKNVIMVDFSYKGDVIDTMANEAKRIVILDHHKTAQAELLRFPAIDNNEEAMENMARVCGENNAPEVMAHFDMEHSGAVLAWKFCNPYRPPPNAFFLIEDRDLWRFKFEDETRRFSAALRTYPQDFKIWNDLIFHYRHITEEGKTVLRIHQHLVNQLCKEVFIQRINGYSVPCVNASYHYASDVAHELLQLNQQAPFAMTWFKRGDGMFQASLRSEDSRVDVSAVASTFGGGGHRNAAGFQVMLETGELRGKA